jgi:hypothetical protein
MPVLELTPEMVGPDRTRLSLSPIENIMLWPDDPTQRSIAANIARATYLQQRVPSEGQVTLPANDFSGMIQSLLSMPALGPFREKAKLPFTHGIVAGLIFLTTLKARQSGRNRNLQQIKADIARDPKTMGIVSRISPSTIENEIWGPYSSVAHFWGAFLWRSFNRAGARTPAEFPCNIADVLRFLALSDVLRLAGERCKVGRGRTLLNPGKTWQLPADLPLPTVSLALDSLTAEF